MRNRELCGCRHALLCLDLSFPICEGSRLYLGGADWWPEAGAHLGATEHASFHCLPSGGF